MQFCIKFSTNTEKMQEGGKMEKYKTIKRLDECDEKEIKELFHEKRKVACALALGYTEVNPSPRPRKNLKDMIQIHDDEEEVE